MSSASAYYGLQQATMSIYISNNDRYITPKTIIIIRWWSPAMLLPVSPGMTVQLIVAPADLSGTMENLDPSDYDYFSRYQR